MAEVSHWALSELAVTAIRHVESPSVDVGKLLGTGPLRVGLDDVHKLLQQDTPSFRLEYDGAVITASREDGGVIGTIAVRF